MESVDVGKKPDWLKIRPPSGAKYLSLKKIIGDFKLNTVCTSAVCPNMGECWSKGNATFMVLGSICTRNCRFCDVEKDKCNKKP